MVQRCYAECHLWSVTYNKPFVLSDIMMNLVMLCVVMLSIVGPFLYPH
jgi:hypothetical protein